MREELEARAPLVYGAVESLDPMARKVTRLRFGLAGGPTDRDDPVVNRDCTLREIATILGIELNQAYSHWRRAQRHLHGLLGPDFLEGEQ